MLHVDCDNDSGDLKIDHRSAIHTSSKRWPSEETLALLKIRSDMDTLFRNSTHKATLWEAVSGKLADLGFNRTPEKCKEKFENLSKYHKRTRDSRSGEPNGKLYRFFDQLEAFENIADSSPPGVQSPTPLSFRPPEAAGSIRLFQNANPKENGFELGNCSSSTASDVGSQRSGKKKKWKAVFAELADEFLRKQDELEKRFLQSLESHDADFAAQDESMRLQEMRKLSLEHEILIQERTASVKNDAAFVLCLEKLQNSAALQTFLESDSTVTSRWPKTEVQALISIRGNLQHKFQLNGSKSFLWEEISAVMKQMGYNRSAKRCKEKWENMNKYFKTIKENDSEKSYESKRCPYVHQLDALYNEKRNNLPLNHMSMPVEKDDISNELEQKTKAKFILPQTE